MDYPAWQPTQLCCVVDPHLSGFIPSSPLQQSLKGVAGPSGIFRVVPALIFTGNKRFPKHQTRQV
jgi:hypothetical protein